MNRHFSKEALKMASKHMKYCSTSLIIGEMQIKTTVSYPTTPAGTATTKKTSREKIKCLYRNRNATALLAGNVKQGSHCRKPHGKQFLKELSLEPPYDRAISRIYLLELKSGPQTDSCVHSGVTIAKKWKPPKCPPRDEGLKMGCIHTMEYYRVLTGKEIRTPASTWVNLETLNGSSQMQGYKYRIFHW